MLAKGSAIWILLPLAAAVVSFLFSVIFLGVIFLIITFFFVIFFRDPERTIKDGIVAPADGTIRIISRGPDLVKVVTVMGVHNVHVNRAPVSGKVVKIEHRPGKHRLAANKEAESNERMEITLRTHLGEVKIIQIAGSFARRIVPYIAEESTVAKGQRIGMIRFGSRLDLLLPEKKVKVLVKEGEKVRAGESTIAGELTHEA